MTEPALPERLPTVRASADAKTILGDVTDPPLAVPAGDPGPPGEPFGRYRLVEPLGEGSMGRVWRAWDTELKREVALKQIRDEESVSRRTLERFLREARIAARLRHPGIIAVHDVGETEGKHYLTMEYIRGRTLEEVLAEGRTARLAGNREILEALPREMERLADIAEAVAHAHAHGVVHRDLKPGNVLLDAGGRPYVMDFGIAKEFGGETEDGARGRRGTLTIAGQLLGTPGYMSPEQARGEGATVGAQSDVWALGVMLYELLTGETPFERAGGAMDILAAAMKQDPVPPGRRRKGVPAELEAVCLKALEKDPARRLAGAGMFAAELRRWVRGDPVETRPPTLTQRLRRRAVRHRAWLGAATALLIAAAAAGYFRWVAAQEQAAARALREDVLAHLRESAGVWLEEALYARRRGDLATARRFRPRLEADVRRVRERLSPPAAEPEYHLGRMLRAMLDEEPAAAAQEAALAIDPDFAPARYEQAVLRARAYRKALTAARKAALARRGAGLAAAKKLELAGLQPEAVAEPLVEEIEREDAALLAARQATVKALEGLKDCLGRAPGWRTHPSPLLRVGEAQLECAAGMLEAYGQDRGWDAARAQLERAIALDPGLEEAYEALAHAAVRARRWEDAVAASTRGLEVDRGYVPHWLNRGTARVSLGNQRDDRGVDAHPDWAGAEEDFARVLELDPGRTEAWIGRARARANQAIALEARGTPADALYSAAIADLGEALARDPLSADAWQQRGIFRANQAVHRAGRGEDARSQFEAGTKDLARAIELEPNAPDSWARRGSLHVNWADHLAKRGEDPTTRYEAAIADLGTALERNPTYALGWAHRGWARLALATWRQRRGANDLDPLYEAAIGDLSHALRIDPASTDTWYLRGAARTNWASARLAAGRPALDLYAAAIEDYGRALELNPEQASAWQGRGAACLNRALLRDDDDPGQVPDHEAAIRDLSRALELNPASSESWVALGMARLGLGLQRERTGQDPTEAWRVASSDFGRAIQANPREAEAYRGRGMTQMYWAGFREERGEVPADLYDGALADFSRSLEANPDQPQVRRWREGLAAEWGPRRRPHALLLLAHAEEALHEGRGPAARAWFEEAIAIFSRGAPDPGDAPVLRAAHYNLACTLALAARGKDGPDEPARAVADADAASLRDAAFRHLEEALRHGWRDRAHAGSDPDLESLRTDTRWAPFLERAGGAD